MLSTSARSVRFSAIAQPEKTSGTSLHEGITHSIRISEHTVWPETSPRSIPPTPFLDDGQLALTPDPSDMTENDSLGVSQRQVYEYPPVHSHTGAWKHHQPSPSPLSAADGRTGHYLHQTQNTPFHPPASRFLSVVAPQLSKYMKAAQKTVWDVRFPPEATAYDSEPALQDASMLSVKISCDQFREDLVHIYGNDGPITVADVYASIYKALLGEVTAEDDLYALRTARERADIQEVTARRLGDPSSKMRQWKGQLRDLLVKDCLLNGIIVNYKTGKWKLEFAEADD